MNKSLRSTLQSSLRISYDEKYKKNCDNIYLDERINKFYECKYCSNEFKIKFLICEECKECHTHSAKDIETKRNQNLRKSSVKSKNTQFILSIKKQANLDSDRQINSQSDQNINAASPFKSGNTELKKGKTNKTPSKSESKSKTQNVKKLSKFAHTIIDNNIVRIDTTNMVSSECMCSLIKHRSLNDGKFSTSKVDKTIIERVSRNTLYNDKNKNTLTSTNTNTDSEAKSNALENEKEVKNVKIFTKCPFKGRYYKPDDPDNKICDICLKNCTKKNKNDLEYNQGNIDFKTIIDCSCPKNTNHENYSNLLNFLLNSEENKTFIDKGFFIENIIFLAQNFLNKFSLIESKYNEFNKIKSRKKDSLQGENDFSLIFVEKDYKSNFPKVRQKFSEEHADTSTNPGENNYLKNEKNTF